MHIYTVSQKQLYWIKHNQNNTTLFPGVWKILLGLITWASLRAGIFSSPLSLVAHYLGAAFSIKSPKYCKVTPWLWGIWGHASGIAHLSSANFLSITFSRERALNIESIRQSLAEFISCKSFAGDSWAYLEAEIEGLGLSDGTDTKAKQKNEEQ